MRAKQRIKKIRVMLIKIRSAMIEVPGCASLIVKF